jgi:hypothetical protein
MRADATQQLMKLANELSTLLANHFVALILDNEVTVGEFVTDPPLPWLRLIQRNGIFQVAEGYPNLLTAEQARLEMRNWDDVSLPAIMGALPILAESVDYVLFGNNAAQGLPIAQGLPEHLVIDRAAIIYANSLPQRNAYQNLGYRSFLPRSQAAIRLLELAENEARPLALCFINTIQHDESNYHDP